MISKRRTKTYGGKDDFKDSGGSWVKSYSSGIDDEGYYTMNYTISGRRWGDMVKRCSLNSQTQVAHPTYKGCTNEFESFSSFVDWSVLQDGYNLKDENGGLWQLDKDLRSDTGKVYSPETCLFVPGVVNRYIINSGSSRGELPIGVTFNRVSRKFQSSCSVGKPVRLGLFDNPVGAHRAWQIAKVKYGETLIEKFSSINPIMTYCLSDYINKIKFDIANDLITSF